jgi:uncharacterized protein
VTGRPEIPRIQKKPRPFCEHIRMSFDPSAIRAAVEKDFQNREFAQNISLGMMRVVRFLNTFHSNVRGRLADLNQKLTQLERRLVFIENQLKCCTNPAPTQ